MLQQHAKGVWSAERVWGKERQQDKSLPSSAERMMTQGSKEWESRKGESAENVSDAEMMRMWEQ